MLPYDAEIPSGVKAYKATGVENNAVVLEEVARMALLTEQLNRNAEPAPDYLQDKHYMRKHGPNAYYGQK